MTDSIAADTARWSSSARLMNEVLQQGDAMHELGLPDSQESEELDIQEIPESDWIFADSFINAWIGVGPDRAARAGLVGRTVT